MASIPPFSYNYAGNHYFNSKTDDDGYFTEQRGIRETSERDDVLQMTGASPTENFDADSWPWVLPPTIIENASKQPAEKFVFRLQKGCPVSVNVRYEGEPPRHAPFVNLGFPVDKPGNLPLRFQFGIAMDKTGLYRCALLPGDYYVYSSALPWTMPDTVLSVSADDVLQETPKKITLDVPAPSMIDLGDENGKLNSLSLVQMTRPPNPDGRGESTQFTSTSEQDAKGRFFVQLSHWFNIISYSGHILYSTSIWAIRIGFAADNAAIRSRIDLNDLLKETIKQFAATT